jgi:anti-sigma factor RsiW
VNIRAHHLQEERLLDCYLAERGEEPLDPRLAEHLADCGACAARYASLTRFMDGLRADADADTDAVFTPERLQAQQHEVARRLEHVGRAARVISFPGRTVAGQAFDVGYGASGRATHGTPRIATRWVAGAAAAGLFFGAALGASFEWDAHTRSQRQVAANLHQMARPAVRLTPVATRGTTPPPVADDDAFLGELEVALERPQTRELQPFDTFTPHVVGVRNTIR